MQESTKTGAFNNIYNVSPEINKAAFIIVSQVGDYRVQVTVTMTSTLMRDEPTPEQAKSEFLHSTM